MAFIKLQFKPGVNRDQTNYSNEGGWWASDKIRFRSGFPEKLGGWLKASPTAFVGVCRQMWNWVTSYNDNFLGVSTNRKVYIEAGGLFYDITPLRLVNPTLSTPVTDNCVSTIINTTTVTLNLTTDPLCEVGSFVTVAGVVGTIGGVPASNINGNRQVTAVGLTSLSFTVATTASSTVASGGGTAISIDFEYAPGNPIAIAGYGWGVGGWGRNTWGLGATTPLYRPQRDWWMDNFDNDLFMNIRNGPGFWWERGTFDDPGLALSTRAIPLPTYATNEGYTAAAVPTKIGQLFLSQGDRHLLAFGAVPFGSTNVDDFDALLIRWADQDNPGQWTPEVTNSAGFIRISRGSRIIRALAVRQETLVWTDTSLYSLQFLGTTDVFGLQEYADNISVASPRAIATAASVVYWMGQDKFYAYTGRVETLPCTLRNYIFQDININQFEQVVCGTNEGWNEIWWFYPSAASDFNDRYVVFNHFEKIWYYGTIDRTAWLDSPLRPYPQAAGGTITSGYVYNHELGADDDVLPMEAYIESNDFDIDDGEQFMLSRRLIPDIGFNGSTAAAPEVTVEIRPRSFPGGIYQNNPTNSQPVIESTVGVYTDQVFIRARARQMAFKIMSEDLGVRWQLGAPRLDARPDGRR